MSEDHVLDASAVLCMMYQESGAQQVAEVLDGAYISAVNYAEVLTKLRDRGIPETHLASIIAEFRPTIADFDQDMAIATAGLRNATRIRGLSLGDRACLALAAHRNAIAVTADQAWRDLTGIVRVLVVR